MIREILDAINEKGFWVFQSKYWQTHREAIEQLLKEKEIVCLDQYTSGVNDGYTYLLSRDDSELSPARIFRIAKILKQLSILAIENEEEWEEKLLIDINADAILPFYEHIQCDELLIALSQYYPRPIT